MKTTLEISDPLLRQAKKAAAARGTTLRAVIEDALRLAFEQDRKRRKPAPIRTTTFGGRGLQPGLSWDDFDSILARSYEGRGG